MQFLKVAKKYFIDSQLYVSLMGTALAVFFMLEQNVLRWPTVLLIFITYFSGYLYTKYQKHRHFNSILIFNIICGLISGALIILNHNEVRLLKWLCIVALGLLYNSFFLDTYIRKIPLLKVFYVGFTWALVNSWLILPYFHPGIFIVSLLFVTALVLPFDIRDMKHDDVVTFPRLIGVQKTKYLASLMLTAGAVISIFTLQTEFAAAFVITNVISMIFVYFSENTNKDAYFSFGVESCSVLPLLITILMKYF
ncbi:hypothetical protein [Chryseobacterium sp.]|uniref:hypothetical protein n=1 Tax=Chryseobacterium sp. TaxID=1871047 RepID=UPI0012A912CB|nr:hypothetical protein [Chryseobacterium sp.]QFG53073.1 hypothetical protein F7R58_05770 [Chryseobacterium sp.]